MRFVNDLNFKKQAEELGVKIWQTPGFLLMVLGFVIVVIMAMVYYISKNYNSPEFIVLAEFFVVVFILVIGNSIIHMVEQIARLNKMKSEFVSVASHQLRTPLSAIRWETELLLSKFKKGLSEKQLKNIKNIDGLSIRMVKLVNDLLDVARIEQKRLILRKEPTDLSKIAKEVGREAEIIAKPRNIEIALNCGKNIPKISSDSNRIKMIMENLVNNAIKYTTNRGKIEIRLFRKNGSVQFSVKDNGVGIPEEQQNRVFDKFFRSDNVVKYQTEGTGLGLYISKNIVEQLGGEIWFRSVENLGSIFVFSIPVGKKYLR